MWTAQDHQHLPKLTTGRFPTSSRRTMNSWGWSFQQAEKSKVTPPEKRIFWIPWCFGKCKHPFRYSNFGVSMLDFRALTGKFNSLGCVIIKIAQRVFVPPHIRVCHSAILDHDMAKPFNFPVSQIYIRHVRQKKSPLWCPMISYKNTSVRMS